MHPTRLDKKAGQVLVLVIVVLFEHGAVLLLADGAIGVVFIGRQLVSIFRNLFGQVKDGVVVCCHIAGVINRNLVWV